MMKRFRFKTMMSLFAVIAMFATSLSVYAQDVKEVSAAQRTVTGKVVDQDGNPVIGAMVVLVGTTNGSATNLDGKYSLTFKQNNASLELSSIGYETVTITLDDHQVVADVVMPTEAVKLDDVVVIGYGVQNKRDVTTAITSIKSDEFKSLPTADFRDAMAAKMPGVQVLTLGGQPDGNVSVRVRGIQSATSGNDPLYVIDGVPCDARAFANIDGSDIESLEVLKDASAAAIYGSRGSCGVILITTKRGSSEKPVVSYDGQFSLSQVAKKIDMLNAYEWAELYVEARNGAYLKEQPTGSIGDPASARNSTYARIKPQILAYLYDETGTLTDTDWQDAIFRTAQTHKHSVSVSARTKNYNYYVGANFLQREGTIIGSDFQRFGARMNLDGKKNRLKYGISFSPSYSKTNYVDSDAQYNADGVIAAALTTPPVHPVYNADGSYNWDMMGLFKKEDNIGVGDTQTNVTLNAVALATEIDDVREKINLIGNAYVGIELFDGLEYKLSLGGDFYSYNRNYYRPSYIPDANVKNLISNRDQDKTQDGLSSVGIVASTPNATYNSNQYFHWNISNQLMYNKKFGDHSVNAIAAYEAEKQNIKTATITGEGLAGDDKIRTTKGKTLSVDDCLNNEYAYTFASWLVRAQYSYKGRYMVSASIRGDGSSRFAPNTRWGYFPAASFGWRISDEPFMKNATWLNDMKIRASVGQTGNAQIGNSEYLALYGSATLDLGNGLVNQVYPNQIANNDLGWEKNTQYNIGVDATLWNGLLNATVDLYYSKTTDMLFDVPVSSVSGLTSSNMNIGSMQNKGLELNLSHRKQIGDFSYELSGNFSLNRNKVLSLGDEDAPIIKTASYSGAYYITQVGQPVGCYYLMVQDGVFHNQEELETYPHFDETLVGDFRFVDTDGDGILEKDDDRQIVGNYMPDFYYGFGLQLGYKGFDLVANFQGVYGNEILNLERRYLCNMEASFNMMKEALNRFPYGELNRATRKSTGNNGACTSTFHLEDGSYLRLQTLSLGYTFPNRWLQKAKVSNLRLYLQGSNLFTLTNYTGYNPEVNKRASDALTPGEDYCSYPVPRTFTVGLSFNL
ncbi:MAG: TonB-dependent receptor [Bacteroidales bacterium]|nr:TonB-dependent receptor [Bacteroidales bacterium]